MIKHPISHLFPQDMRLFLHCLAIVSVFGLCLAGCVRPGDGPVEIQVSFWGSTQQLELEKQVIAAFEAANPDVRVRPLPIGARYAEKVQAMMIGNVAPDVVMVEMVLYDEWASRGVLSDITDLVQKVDAADPLMPIPAKAFQRDGQYFAMPINVHGLVMYANLDALDAMGIPYPDASWTWEDMLALGPQLSSRAGNPDSPTDFLMMLPPPDMLFFSHGAELFDNALKPTRVVADSPQARAAFETMRKFFWSGYVVPPDVSDAQGTFQLFRDGRVAFFFSGRWVTPEFVGATNFEWDVFQVPAGADGAITIHGGTALGMWSGSRNKEAARRFIEFYSSKDGQEILLKGGRYAPVSRNAAFSPEFMAHRPPESVIRYSETMEDGAAKIFLYAPGQAQVTRIFQNRVSQALTMRDLSTDTIVKGLATDLERWLARTKTNVTERKAEE